MAPELRPQEWLWSREQSDAGGDHGEGEHCRAGTRGGSGLGRFIIFITALSVCLVLFHCLKLLVNLPEEGAVLDAPGSRGACSATEGGNAQQGHPQRKSKAPSMKG